MKILLVDDEVMILNGLKRALFGTGWKILTATSGEDALDMLKVESVDMIISDMMMPGMDGSQLLKAVSEQYPGIIRASLSGYSEPKVAIKGGFFAHQSFMKPCEPAVIIAEIKKINDILTLFPDKVIQQAIGKLTTLPSPPRVFFETKRLLDDGHSSMHEIATTISQDPAICAKVLQVANSAMFRGTKEIGSIDEAITRLGSQIVTNLIAMLEVYAVSLNEPSKPLESIQNHSLQVAKLAQKLGDNESKDLTFLVGILHQVGEVVRMKIAPKLMKAYLDPATKGQDKSHLEKHLFHTRSEQLGGYLLHFWGFPLTIIENILIINEPKKLMEVPFGPACAVYIARCLIDNKEIDEDIITHFQLEDKISHWQRTA
ncbi:HDOD domain-containing protein [Vibrio mexicanus]|uniref:HDOD domain-containing protein n=1 Tax=Vibrio mexicanus TaxID=1004326 RepID=UPI00063C9E42|nr:HDOD domain-containing protein [Vibrio mexicanus]